MADTSVTDQAPRFGPGTRKEGPPAEGPSTPEQEGDILMCEYEAPNTDEDADRKILSDDYVGDYRYPLDLPLNKAGVSYITFEAQYVEGADIAGATLDFIRWLGTRDKDQPEKPPGTGEEGTEDTTEEEQTTTAQQEIDIDIAGEATLSYELPSGERVGGVSLYLPQSLVFSDAANYTAAEIGTIGGIAELVAEGRSVLNDDGSLATGGIAQLATSMATVAGVGAAGGGIGALVSKFGKLGSDKLAAGIGAIAGGSTIANAATSIARATTNPNIRTLFQSVNPRDFRFAFRLVGQSHDEAEEIKRIIKFFRGQVYPETIRLAGIPFGYIFPNIFNIKMYYGVEEIATKILPSYLTSVQVTYNPSGAGMHSDGNFVDVDIQIAFSECTTLDKERVQQGY